MSNRKDSTSGCKFYAPIIIPTLNRFDHFKECIESLSRCKFADQTEVYVGLDYPSKDSHWEGYLKIKAYLQNCGDLGFKKLNVIIRDRNYGMGTNGNASTLIETVRTNHSAYIFTEDDNVFSPNFIEYMNKGLEMTRHDPRCLAICGYAHYDQLPHLNNNYYRLSIGFSPWGYAASFSKIDKMKAQLTRKYYLKKLINPVTFFKAMRRSYSTLLFLFIGFMKGGKIYSDNIYNLYIWLEDMYIISPVISKVRNEGFDGSGLNCGVDDTFANRLIDENTEFDFIGTGDECVTEVSKILLNGQRKYIDFNRFVKTLYAMSKAYLLNLFKRK